MQKICGQTVKVLQTKRGEVVIKYQNSADVKYMEAPRGGTALLCISDLEVGATRYSQRHLPAFCMQLLRHRKQILLQRRPNFILLFLLEFLYILDFFKLLIVPSFQTSEYGHDQVCRVHDRHGGGATQIPVTDPLIPFRSHSLRLYLEVKIVIENFPTNLDKFFLTTSLRSIAG